jgi:hypothetical protein
MKLGYDHCCTLFPTYSLAMFHSGMYSLSYGCLGYFIHKEDKGLDMHFNCCILHLFWVIQFCIIYIPNFLRNVIVLVIVSVN